MSVDEVEVEVEHDRDLRLLADGGHGLQDLGRRGAGLQPALGGKLVDRAVRQRVAKRHPQLVEGQRQLAGGLKVRIARTDIDYETLLPLASEQGESFFNAVHPGRSFGVHAAGFKLQVGARELAFPSRPFPARTLAMQRVIDYLRQNEPRAIDELCEYVRFPSVSAQPQ